jgi:biotin carboxyl carrier protein
VGAAARPYTTDDASMRYYVTIRDREFEVDLGGDTPRIDGTEVRAELVSGNGTGIRHVDVDGRSFALLATPGERKGDWRIVHRGIPYRVDAVDERTRTIREMVGGAELESAKSITAPMPGLVLKVQVEEGQKVQAGQGVVVVEAMKMENELKASADGVVTKIEVSEGDTVDKGAVLVVIE